MMRNALFAVILAALLPLAASAEAPEWVVKGSAADGDAYFAVGSGPSREAAALNALAELARIRKIAAGGGGAEEQSVSAAAESKARESFGPITVASVVKDSLGKDDESSLERRVETTLKAGKESVLVKTVQQDVAASKGGRERVELEIQYKGLAFADIMEELPRQGIAVRTYADPADLTQYVGLKLPRAGAKPLPPRTPAGPGALPSWTRASGRQPNGFIVVSGSGRSRAEALAQALGKLSAETAADAFGPVLVKRSSEMIEPGGAVKPEAPGDEGQTLAAMADETMLRAKKANLLRSRTEVRLKNQNGSLTLVAAGRSVAGAQSMDPIEEKVSVELQSDGLTLDNLVAELKSQGVAVRSHVDPASGEVHIGLAVEAPGR